MKTLKTLTIIFGIAIGIIGLISTTTNAEGLAKETKSEKSKVVVKVYDAEMQETENFLIENYLQMVDFEKTQPSITIVNESGSTVYEGTKENAADLLKRSDYLFSFGEEEHYLITE